MVMAQTRGRMLTDEELFSVLYKAGFRGASLIAAMAIVYAESNGDSGATNTRNRNGSTDRGLWQINNKAHANVSDSCAYDEHCASKEAFRISKNGTDFSPWSAYKNGSYKSFMIRSIERYTKSGPSLPNQGPNPKLFDILLKMIEQGRSGVKFGFTDVKVVFEGEHGGDTSR